MKREDSKPKDRRRPRPAKPENRRRGEVLVAIVNEHRDFAAAKEAGWYRIPVASVEKWLKDRWPPRWLAFYQTKVFGSEGYAVNHYAQVLDIQVVTRHELFPDEPEHEKTHKHYHKLILGALQRLPKPIVSRRWRRIVFIPTTWHKLMTATEINDLFDESPLEDDLWAQFKRLKIVAERQEFVEVKPRFYALDFAVYCTSGKLDVEADGDTWHAVRERIPMDNLRDNDLETGGWRILRFNGHQVREEMGEYCLPTIAENINRLGGLDEERRVVPRHIHLDSTFQMDFFDD